MLFQFFKPTKGSNSLRQTIIFLIASCLIAVLPHAAFAQTTSNIDKIDFDDECELGQRNASSTSPTRVALANGHCTGWVLSLIAIADGDYQIPADSVVRIHIKVADAQGRIQTACRIYKKADYETRNSEQAFQNGVCRSAVKAYDDYAGCRVWDSFKEISTNLAAGRFSDPCE